jgi:superfamily II DNA or RNA helicase
MQIFQNKALLLRLKNPAPVLAAVPDSHAVDANTVAVKWDVPQTHALRRLKLSAPSPITGRYNWPGKHRPFQHQKDTAAFLTLHQRAFCFSEQGCVDSETEYLSPTGWVKISEYKGGPVAQFLPHSASEIEFVEPEAYVKLPCTDMIRIKTQYGVDQLLSPEHRVLLEDGKANHHKVETLSAAALAARHDAYHAGVRQKVGGCRTGTQTIALSSATIPTTFLHIPTTSMPFTDAELRVLVAAIADGYFPRTSTTKHCTVRLKKQRKKDRLRDLLVAANIEFNETPCLPDGFTKFTFYAPERWKEFGPEFWSASSNQLDVIVDEVLHWDGCVTRGARFSTHSKASADFVQYAFSSRRNLGNGGTARVLARERRGTTEYTVQIRPRVDRLYIRGTDATIWHEPSTDGFKYCFQVPSTYLLFRRNGCIFASGNTGKTSSAIWAADFLMTRGIIRRVLVVCPVSIMGAAWRADLFNVAMHRTVDIAYGSAEKRRKILAGGAEFIVINFDGLQIVKDDILASNFDLIIVDEASSYQNTQTRRWKTLHKLLKPDTWLWMMTGTPAAQGPEKAYGLAKLVNPDNTPKTFGTFRDQVMYKITQFKWGVKDTAVDTVYRLLQPAIRFTKDECLDLPDLVYTKRDVEMTPQQKRVYEKIRKEMLLSVGGETVTAANAAIVMTKLLQVSSGSVYTDDQNTIHLDIASRYKVLKEVVDEAANKLLVFVPYKHTIKQVAEKLRADGVTCDVISGDVKAGDRTDVFHAFQTATDPRVLIIQPQAAAHGVTLTAADTIVWWGPVASLETYAQANARIHRHGQVNKCTVVQLVGSQVERRVYSMLDDKIDVHSRLIDLYQSLLD